jgi:hypothetical protein
MPSSTSRLPYAHWAFLDSYSKAETAMFRAWTPKKQEGNRKEKSGREVEEEWKKGQETPSQSTVSD